MFILQGTPTTIFRLADMADRFASASREAGGAADLQEFAGEPHMFVTKDPTTAASRKALALMQEFVQKQITVNASRSWRRACGRGPGR